MPPREPEGAPAPLHVDEEVGVPLVQLLLEGARYGDEEDVLGALNAGAAVDAVDDQGRTALHMAAANGHLSVVELLLSHNASPSTTNREGNTPLHFAALNGHVPVVERLLAAGASPSSLNSHGRTPYDEAMDRGWQAVLDAINTATLTAEAQAGLAVQEDEQA